MRLLGIHGKKQSGKDTAAQLLVSRILPGWDLVHFAAALKSTCSQVYGVPLALFYDEHGKEEVLGTHGLSPRQMMTGMHDILKPLYGDDLFIRPVERHWQGLLAADLDGQMTGVGGLIVADVRYENEADWVRSQGGLILHLHRETGLHSAHSSEQGIQIKPEDCVIKNNATVGHLEEHLHEFVRWWDEVE